MGTGGGEDVWERKRKCVNGCCVRRPSERVARLHVSVELEDHEVLASEQLVMPAPAPPPAASQDAAAAASSGWPGMEDSEEPSREAEPAAAREQAQARPLAPGAPSGQSPWERRDAVAVAVAVPVAPGMALPAAMAGRVGGVGDGGGGDGDGDGQVRQTLEYRVALELELWREHQKTLFEHEVSRAMLISPPSSTRWIP